MHRKALPTGWNCAMYVCLCIHIYIYIRWWEHGLLAKCLYISMMTSASPSFAFLCCALDGLCRTGYCDNETSQCAPHPDVTNLVSLKPVTAWHRKEKRFKPSQYSLSLCTVVVCGGMPVCLSTRFFWTAQVTFQVVSGNWTSPELKFQRIFESRLQPHEFF